MKNLTSSRALAAILPALTTRERMELLAWISTLETIQPPYQSAYREIASRFGVSTATVRRKHDLLRRLGPAALAPARADREPALAPELIEFWKSLCQLNQRKSKPAYRLLLKKFFAGEPIPGIPNDQPRNQLPRGWSYRNFMRFSPNRFELTAARIGRSAAAAYRPLVFTTRRHLQVGQFFVFDDLWHDHFCNILDTRQCGRPLEFHALDLASGCKFAWGMQLRAERPDGTETGLTESAMRFLLAYVLAEFGYNPITGTTLIVEHGTAAIREDVERLLHSLSNGKITVHRGGIQRTPAFPGQFSPAGRGNPRAKAHLESLTNLIHNEMGFIPGQTGPTRDARPEGLHGLLQYNQKLLSAAAALPEDLARELKFPVLEFRRFQELAGQIYDAINSRTDHQLEGWEDRHTIDPSTGLLRRLSPREVFDAGRPHLTPLPPHATAMILGPDLGVERTVGANHIIEFQDRSVAHARLRFLATELQPGSQVITVLNPFHPSALFTFDQHGRFIAALPRLDPVDRADIEAIHRACGRAAAIEAELLAPVAARGAALTRARAHMHAHNAAVLARAGRPAPPPPDPALAAAAADDILDTQPERTAAAAADELPPAAEPPENFLETILDQPTNQHS
ncbi:MAG: hypothetical protein N3J91_07000 [Verrucomicrobiae bacterium]|nr:hypothetical protein [Verrucomicrobiae bacterium]